MIPLSKIILLILCILSVSQKADGSQLSAVSFTQWYYNGDMIWREDRFSTDTWQLSNTIHYLAGEGLDSWLARETYDPATQVGRATLNWFLTDRMGSVQAVTDKDGTILESCSYSAFGQRSILNSTLSIPNSLGFTGREHDVETGLTYYRARYMDPGFRGKGGKGVRSQILTKCD